VGRYDKYDPISGGFRARLAANWAADPGEPVGVGLNSSGKVVPGAGNSGIVGVVIVVSPVNGPTQDKAGDVVDVMTDGEILEVDDLSIAAGTAVFAANSSGALDDTGDVAIGFTVEADRLVVRVGGGGGS